MKNRISVPLLVLIVLSSFFVTSCEFLGSVFQTGVGVGIFIAVAILLLILFVSRIGKRK